jgi:hypothetical protein
VALDLGTEYAGVGAPREALCSANRDLHTPRISTRIPVDACRADLAAVDRPMSGRYHGFVDQPAFDPTTRAWLMSGDPAIRWQVLRDLDHAPAADVERERRLVAAEGWGARLLALQDPVGTWAGQMYTPKWTSTTYTMLLLRQLGLPAENEGTQAACAVLLDRGLFHDGGISFGWGRSETCVTSIVLSILAAFRFDDERVDRLVDRLLAEQMDDGGWNCRRPRGARHSSMNTTILALEGLLLYEGHRGSAIGGLTKVREAQARGQEFLLVHRLFRSHRSGGTCAARADPTSPDLAWFCRRTERGSTAPRLG